MHQTKCLHLMPPIKQQVVTFILCASLLLGTSSWLRAQAPGTSAITGTIFDPSSAVVPRALVTVVDEATGWSRTAIATAEGQYRVPLLPQETIPYLWKRTALSERSYGPFTW